jgi:SPOR domain
MSDAQAYDSESLPWLEAVENDEGPRAISARKMLVALILVMLAGLIVAGAMFWLGRQDPAPGGAPELIRAEPGPYKVKPTDPGGLDVAGDSETAYSTSAGEDPDAALDVRKLPQEMTPLAVETPQAAAPQPKKIPPNEVKEPASTEPKAAPAAAAPSGPTIQLGAYASTVKADTAWKLLSGRFPTVAALNKAVVTANVGGKSVYRLRASGSSDQTKAACAALKAAGESCMVVQ